MEDKEIVETEVVEEKVDETPDNSVKEEAGDSTTEETDEGKANDETEDVGNQDTEEQTEETDYSKVEDSEEAAKILETKGFDYAALSKEYNETGKISKETRAKLAEVGITDEVIDNFISGQEAKAEVERNQMAECIGGRQVFDEVLKWAAVNIPADEIASINQVRDKNIIKIILKDLKARMEDKEGITPDYTKGDGKITYNSDNVNKITDAYKLDAKSIVVLEFKDNCRILNADKKSGNVSYETNFVNQKNYNAICAAYKGDSLLNIKSVFISSDGNTTGTLNMGDTLLKADKLKLFVWNLDKLYPLCEADEYTLE